MNIQNFFLLIFLLTFLAKNTYGISINKVVCPADHSINQTDNISSERLHLNDTLAHSVFKVRAFKFDISGPPENTTIKKKWRELGTATLVYKSKSSEAFFITAEHILNINGDEYLYLYAPGMDFNLGEVATGMTALEESTIERDKEHRTGEMQISVDKNNIFTWGKYKYGNTKYCEYQGLGIDGCNNGLTELGIVDQNKKFRNADIAVIKVENFNWDSNPVDLDLKFNDVDLDGDFHLLGYPENLKHPILVTNIPPRQIYQKHYSPAHVYDGQSGSLLVSDFGVGYAIQSKYYVDADADANENEQANAQETVVTPLSEVMSFLHDRLYHLPEQHLSPEQHQAYIEKFFKKVLVNPDVSVDACDPTDLNCHLVDQRKINLLLRQNWNDALRISLIIRNHIFKTLPDPENSSESSNIEQMHHAIESCTDSSGNSSINICNRSHSGFDKLSNSLLSLGANTRNRKAISQMLSCTIGEDEAEIYSELSRILKTFYTVLGEYISPSKVTEIINVAQRSESSLFKSLLNKQKEELSIAFESYLEKRNDTPVSSNIFINTSEIREVTDKVVNLNDSINLSCSFFEKEFKTATKWLRSIDADPLAIRRSDGHKWAAEQKYKEFKEIHKHSTRSLRSVSTCYNKRYNRWMSLRKRVVIDVCSKAKKSSDYYKSLDVYSQQAIEKCYKIVEPNID